MAESAVKKFLVRNAFMVAFMGLFFTFLIVVTVLGAFTFVSIRAGNARIEANIAASRAEPKAGIEGPRADMDRAGIEGLGSDWKADVDKLEAAIEGLRSERTARRCARSGERAWIDLKPASRHCGRIGERT